MQKPTLVSARAHQNWDDGPVGEGQRRGGKQRPDQQHREHTENDQVEQHAKKCGRLAHSLEQFGQFFPEDGRGILHHSVGSSSCISARNASSRLARP
jgi:hypothetical protein